MGNIFRSGVERQNVVQYLMIEKIQDLIFDECEIFDHAVGVKLSGLAFNSDYPVMSVKRGAFALIAQVELT